MKKLLWTVAALAALSFAVVGCNQNTDDATKTDTSTGSTTTGSTTTGTDANKTDGTTTTTTTTTTPTETPAETPAETTKVASGIIIGDTVYAWKDLTIEGGYSNDSYAVETDSTLNADIARFEMGSYANWKIALTNTIDITDKKIVICAKALDGKRWNDAGTAKDKDSVYADTQGFKLAFQTDDTHCSETCQNDKNNAGWCSPFTSEYKEYTATDIWKQWSKDDSIEAADLTKIANILVQPQGTTGDVYIQYIKFVD